MRKAFATRSWINPGIPGSAGMITAALISGIGELVSGNTRWRSREGVMIGAGASVVTALGGYLLWTTRRRR